MHFVSKEYNMQEGKCTERVLFIEVGTVYVL